MKIHESGENYLESILTLKKKNGSVRAIDIVNDLGFSKPSVSRAVSHLKNDGYIHVDNEGHITLTDAGLSQANKIYDRHTVLSQALMLLGVDKKTAEDDACKMEHHISEATFEAFKKQLD